MHQCLVAVPSPVYQCLLQCTSALSRASVPYPVHQCLMAVLSLTTPANIQTAIDRHEDAIDRHETNAFGQSLQRQKVVLDTGDRMYDTVAG